MAGDMESVGGLRAETELDTSGLEQGTQEVIKQFDTLASSTKAAERGLTNVEKAGQKAGTAASNTAKQTSELNQSLKGADAAARAFNITLGILGAGSIEAVIQKVVALTKEAAKMAITLEGVAARSKAVFKSDFQQVTQEIEKMGAALGRSTSDLQEFATGFALTLDSIGVAPDKMRQYSLELTRLTAQLGKAFPDKTDAEIFQVVDAAIAGNVRGLRQLGISLKDNQLQQFAAEKGIRKKLEAISEEEKAQLRVEYLLSQTTTAQNAANEAAGKSGDIAKENSARWRDWMETIGQITLPIFNAVSKGILDNIDRIVRAVTSAQTALLNFYSLGYYGQFKKLGEGSNLAQQNADFQAANGIGLGKAREQFKAATPAATGTGGGGGSDDTSQALSRFKSMRQELEATEKAILTAINDQAEANKKRLQTVREELEFKRAIGIITTAEARELDRINGRIEFQTDLVADLRSEWEKNVGEVKKLRDELEGINQDIVDLGEDTEKRLAAVDAETARKKQERINDLVREKNELRQKLGDNPHYSGGNADAQRLYALNQELEKIGSSASGRLQLQEADRIAALTPEGLIDEEAKQKKLEITSEHNAKLDELVQKQSQVQQQLDSAIAKADESKTKIIETMDSLRVATEDNYTAMTATVSVNVDAQVAKINELKAALESLRSSYAGLDQAAAAGGSVSQVKRKYATGGPVIGPGTGTSDSINAALSNGEHVWTAKEVLAAGGHGAIMALRRAILNGGMRIARFAAGGPVTSNVNNAREFNITQNFNSPAMTDPRLMKYTLRSQLR